MLKRGRVTVEGCDVDEGFEVIDESPDLIELWRNNGSSARPDLVAAGWSQLAAPSYTYRQTFEKTDARLGGFLGLVEHAGYRLRFTERRESEVHVVSCRHQARLLGLKQDDVTGFGWVLDRGDATPRPILDQTLIRSLIAHNEVLYAPLARTFRVVGETANTLTLWEQHTGSESEALVRAGFRADFQPVQTEYDLVYNFEHYLDVPKLSGDIPGPFSRWVSHRGIALRVIAEREGHVLAIAHPALGKTLAFTELQPMGNVISQSFRWIAASDVEGVNSAVLPKSS